MTQYTEAELFQKLRNADEAGDSDGASRIAEIIREQRGGGLSVASTAAPAADPGQAFVDRRLAEARGEAARDPRLQAAPSNRVEQGRAFNDRLQATAQGMSLGTSDNIGAYTESLRMLLDDDTFGPDQRTWEDKKNDFWASKDELTADRKAQRDKFAAENPGEALLYEIAGGVLLPGFGGAKAAVKGVDTVAKAAGKTAIVGGLEGGVYGAGTADGDPMLMAIGKNALIGATGGALLGSAGQKIGKHLKAKKAAKNDALNHGLINKAELAMAMEVAKNPQASPGQIMAAAQRVSGLDADEVGMAVAATGRKFEVPTQAKAKFLVEQERLVREAATPKTWLAKKQAEVGGYLDDIGGAVSTRIKNANQGVFNGVRKHDYLVHTKTQNYMKRAEGLERLNTMRHKGNKAAIKSLLANNRYDEAIAVAKQTGDMELVEGLHNVRAVLEDIRGELGDVNYTIPENANYFPRVVKDPASLRNKLGRAEQSKLDLAKRNWAKRNKKHVTDITENQEAKLINTLLREGSIGGKGGQLGASKARTVDFIGDSLMDEYHDPVEAIGEYIRRSVEDIEERRFFGAHARGGSGTSNIDVKESVGGYLAALQGEGKINGQQFDELQELLSVRFGSGKVGPGKLWQNLKNIGLMTALGNPKSALIQLADLGMAGYQNGFRNAAVALFGRNYLDVGDLGLDNVIQSEFNSMGKTAGALDGLLKITGFKKIDQIGKNTLINSSMRKNIKATESAKGRQFLEKKYGAVFEDELPQLIEDFRNGTISDNVKLAMWHDLSDAQPIALSEMPKKYLEMENGRVFWALKSFALKQADIMRRDVIQKWKSGDKWQAQKNLMAYTAFTGGSTFAVNEGRNALFSGGADPINPADVGDGILWHMLAMTGIVNKYNVDKVAKSGNINDIIEGIIPPLGLVSAAAGDIVKAALGGDTEFSAVNSQTVKAIPFVGGSINMFLGDGMEKVADKQKRERASARNK